MDVHRVRARHQLELSLEFGNSSELEPPGLVRLELESAQLVLLRAGAACKLSGLKFQSNQTWRLKLT
jgi:hypothetical protein